MPNPVGRGIYKPIIGSFSFFPSGKLFFPTGETFVSCWGNFCFPSGNYSRKGC
ncbi:hypothetical protein HMPREF1981_02586 [Bacteroides pyogenes F0041]|uniref:Uncharacterized protein n=1 Tax=Bacteroides pyogenes F0041 TaxID=1321819 RepID=U2C044_9BACE|nr:hypothetical protein HMPREF1981_02586 [Bacteroides pyogenes F0041]